MGLTIGVDADDVILELLGGVWLPRYNERYEDDLTPESFPEWDMIPYVRPECGAKIYDILKEEDLYVNCPIVPGAIASINKLRAAGHTVIVITAADNPSKLVRLMEVGVVRDATTEYVVEEEKWKVPVSVLIDDNYMTIETFNRKRPNGIGILFNRYHNERFLKNYYWRAHGWGGVMLLLEEITRAQGDVIMGAMDILIDGVGKNAPTVVNENGGKQSALEYRFDLVDPLTMFQLANILHNGAMAYGEWNWRRISLKDNLNHALSHIYAYLAGDRQDDHLGHAFCRLMFALSLELTPGESERMKPDHD